MFGKDAVARGQDLFERRKVSAVERPIRVRPELLVSLVESIDRKKERLGIADVHGDRQSKATARIPHRIESLVVNAHEFPGWTPVAQVEPKRLQYFQADCSGGFCLRDLVRLPCRVPRFARTSPGRFGHRDEASRKRAIEVSDRRDEVLSRSAREID